MKRYERTRVLVEGSPEVARLIAVDLEEMFDVEILDEPREELVMVKVRESAHNSLFYLGEALMCSCRVRLNGVIGFGFALGDRRDAAYNLALVDAVFSDEDTDIAKKTHWQSMIEKEQKRIQAKAEKQHEMIERTRVDFSVMESED